MRRRSFLAAAAPVPLWACSAAADSAAHITGGFTGNDHARGHQLRDRKTWPTPAVTHRAHTVIVGGGVAGLAAARALRLREQDDFVLLELEDRAGGNARGGTVGGIACPLGAHYLPLPSDDAPEVQDLLEELGLRQRVAGRWQYDERHLCHSPQERLFFNGAWQDGLLPVHGVGEATLAQYRRFAVLVEQARQAAKWTIPTRNRPLDTVQRALVAITFIAYLDQNGLDDPQLRWYLDYCCRDDYGTGIATVSAWAGIHYFASRHGFHAPGAETAEREGLLTWPEGNAWLTRRLAAPLGDRLRTGSVVLRVAQGRHGVEVDAFNTAKQRVERWQAQQAIVALPIFIAARVVEGVPDFLRQAAQRVVYAPWLVANIHLREPLRDRPGAAPSWDNVVYGTQGLGYVDAMHQSLHPVPGATVLTHYRALGDVPGGPAAGRRQLLAQPWTYWRDTIVAELAAAHPDLAAKATRMELTRYGHAMAIPLPSNHGQIGLWPPQNLRKQLSKQKQLALAYGRLRFAHSDWAGYSIFEEAFTLGHWAGA
ncbi:hypothetical protein CHU94_14730 [Rhodoferax sp. TH121]|nr:hypothetical protein CHU94_14730 [Rhodoferax sp. TH121]